MQFLLPYVKSTHTESGNLSSPHDNIASMNAQETDDTQYSYSGTEGDPDIPEVIPTAATSSAPSEQSTQIPTVRLESIQKI